MKLTSIRSREGVWVGLSGVSMLLRLGVFESLESLMIENMKAGNVHPCVERRTSSRDRSNVYASPISPPRVYEVFVNMLLLFSGFSDRKPVYNKINFVVVHTVDDVAIALMAAIIVTPLLNYNCLQLFKFRCHYMTVFLQRI